MKKILLYNDKGVSIDFLEHIHLTIKDFMGVSPEWINAKTLSAGGWQKSASHLIIPGGRDRFYHQALFPEGTRSIKEFVTNGGTYIGICAGAYFAAASIEFEKGGELEITGERDLGFFPGVAVGPAYGLGKFRYDHGEGACVGKIVFSDGLKSAAYFHGGCFFQDPQQHPNVEVVAHYEDLPGRPAAIVRCKVGKGEAVLSGVHWECFPELLPSHTDDMSQIRTILLELELVRRSVLKRIVMTNQ